MKKLIFLLVTALFFACSQKMPTITFTNESENALQEKPISISRADIEAHTGKVKDSQIVLLSPDEGKTFIVSQLDDLDGDSKWDELFTLIDFEPKGTVSFSLIVKDKAAAPNFKVRTNIRFADKKDPKKEFTSAVRLKNSDTETTQKYFQFEGPGWENDVVGFRNYFDARNGMDIWGKTTGTMILDQVGLAGGPTYHELQPWGMDILKVANSLGSGAIALKNGDELYRIGPDGKGTYQLVTEGVIRSVFDLKFEEIPYKGQNVDINHRIGIIAGKPWYKSEITVKGAPAGTTVVTGIVNLETDTLHHNQGKGYAYMFTHDNQAFDGEKLGMAVFVPQNSIQTFAAPEVGEGITQTYYTTMEISDKPCIYYFMAGWEKQDPRWANIRTFEDGINENGKLAAAKVSYTISKK